MCSEVAPKRQPRARSRPPPGAPAPRGRRRRRGCHRSTGSASRRRCPTPPPTKVSTAGATVTTPLTTDPVPTAAGVTAATAPETDPATPATPSPTKNPRSPTTSSPVLLEGPPSPHPRTTSPPDRRSLRERHSSCSERRDEATSPTVSPTGVMRAARGSASLVPARPARTRGVHHQGRFVPARWPFSVAHLRTQFNPTGPRSSHTPTRPCSPPPIPFPLSGSTDYK
ncbi:hypothetical protein PF001_g23527 [Phytophthora fragariae]|uniref:Uncharacterized protein n=1 Tax=Phytophthora fragariae TaxID=53985 RepID=A0A6A4C141_9STRA|nr:hypothetical protein PF001_g23527 [Phytophthora fragariae]